MKQLDYMNQNPLAKITNITLNKMEAESEVQRSWLYKSTESTLECTSLVTRHCPPPARASHRSI